MSMLIVFLTGLIAILEFGNLCKGGNNISVEGFTLISITATLVSTIYGLKIKENKAIIILSGWLCFMVAFFAIGIGDDLIKVITPLSNILNLSLGFIYPILYNWFRKKD